MPQHPLCAVVDCLEPGRPRLCPFDGARHHHGCIHYGGNYPVSSLPFRPDADGWHWICDAHYRIICQERTAFEQQNKKET